MNKVISVIIPSLPEDHETNKRLAQDFMGTQPTTQIILSERNAPFSRNVNDGLRKAQGDILLICNNDVTVLPGWFEYLQNNALSNQILSMTPKPDCGWAFALSRELFEKVGYLDEKLINSYDDYDYFIRAALAGARRIVADRFYLLHEGGRTINNVWGELEEKSEKRLAQCNANREYMQRKWPGLNIDSVPFLDFALNGPEIVKGLYEYVA